MHEITEAVTGVIGDHGLYAVFVLMLVDAVFPAASELVMVYAGAIAIGAFPGQSVVLFGSEIESTPWGYVAMAAAVLVSRVLPVVRSFISIPAGIAEMPLVRYTVLTFLGTIPWCFGLAGAGLAFGAGWERFQDAWHFADYAFIALLAAGGVYLLVRARKRRLRRRALERSV